MRYLPEYSEESEMSEIFSSLNSNNPAKAGISKIFTSPVLPRSITEADLSISEILTRVQCRG